jgi:hypothetical protein
MFNFWNTNIFRSTGRIASPLIHTKFFTAPQYRKPISTPRVAVLCPCPNLISSKIEHYFYLINSRIFVGTFKPAISFKITINCYKFTIREIITLIEIKRTAHKKFSITSSEI